MPAIEFVCALAAINQGYYIAESGRVAGWSTLKMTEEVYHRWLGWNRSLHFLPTFCFWQVGVISSTSSIRPILLKNIGDASVSLVAWFGIGYALASGEDKWGIFGCRFFAFTGKSCF